MNLCLTGLGMLSHPVTCCSEVSSEIETDDLQDNKFTPEAAILNKIQDEKKCFFKNVDEKFEFGRN